MRSILITVAVAAVLVVAFTVFLLLQKHTVSAPKRARGTATSLPVPKNDATGSTLGGGESSWVQSFNKKTGELDNEFRADHFDPPVDNLVHVIRPDARFYGKDGQVLTLSATYGDITMAESTRRTDRLGAMQSQPPSHGILHDVTLGLLETPEATVPVLTCKLPIVAFDNDTLRLNTIPMTANGQEIAADRIPVTVRGRDYDFDGQGLTVRYNQRDRRLEFLEVAHGQRLLIKNPKAFGGAATRPVSTRPAAARPAVALGGVPLFDGDRPIELASADPAAAPRMTAEERDRREKKRAAAAKKAAHDAKEARAKGLPATKPATTKPAVPRPPREAFAYRATFVDDVALKEGDAPIGTADRMTTTFTFGNDNATTRPATEPAVLPVATPAASAGGKAAPSTRPVRRVRPTTQAATVQPTPAVAPTRAARRLATQPAATAPGLSSDITGPIEIKWTGKLTVVPEKLVDSGLRSPQDRIVEFTGRPVHLQREGSTIVAAYVWAAVEGDRFRAAPDATTPTVTLQDAAGNLLTTESIDADGDDAILHGKSSAEMVVNASAADVDASKPPQKLLTTWTDFATLRLTNGPSGHPGIERAVFRGHVIVRHPQLNMTSDSLALGFLPGVDKAQPQLSTVRADGTVRATVTGEDGAKQSISAATLDLGTAVGKDGALAVRALHAHGEVVAGDDKQTLHTDDLNTTLAEAAAGEERPAGQGMAFAVDTLTATGRVRFETTDGATAVADRLNVERVGGAQWVTLVGTPARVTDPKSAVTGDTIRVDATGAHASIDGPGTLSGRPQSTDDKPTQPIDVVWSRSMHYDGADNVATIDGDVVVTSHGNDGTTSTAEGRTLDVAFADAPTTQPSATQLTTTKPASTKPASTKPSGFGIAGGGNKQVKLLTLRGGKSGNVEVNSQLFAPSDPARLIRRTYLEAPAVIVATNPDGSPGAMDVPSGGRMLYQDFGTPATQPAAAAAAPAGPVGGRGAVAIEWNKRMHYEPALQQVFIEGAVIVKHQTPGEEPMEMLAPRLVADVTGGAGAQGGQLKKMTADQGATLRGKQMQVDAARAVYEPALDRIIATGTPRQPVQWTDEKGGMTHGSIGELWWNLKTNQPDKVIDVTVQMNR